VVGGALSRRGEGLAADPHRAVSEMIAPCRTSAFDAEIVADTLRAALELIVGEENFSSARGVGIATDPPRAASEVPWEKSSSSRRRRCTRFDSPPRARQARLVPGWSRQVVPWPRASS
jgi:hypothetical protein